MKIFYIINGRIPTEKANGYQISQMCQAFEENGYSVELLRPQRELLKEHKQFKKNLKEFYNLRKELSVKDIFSIDFQYIFHKLAPSLDRFQFITNALHSWSFVFGLAWYLRNKKDNGTILYLRDVNILSWLWPFLNSILKQNIVLELHYMPEGIIKKKRYINILKLAKLVICITDKMKTDIISLGLPTEKICVEHDGVDLATFTVNLTKEECRQKLGYPQHEFIVGYVGNFHTNGREKGIDDLIKSSVLILKENPQTKFYFIGGPLDRISNYEKIIQDLNLPKENFKFFDRKPVSMVPICMRACDILTIPLPWNEHFAYYMSPMKLFEYMSSGQVIVATDVEALKEILRDKKNSLLARHTDIIDLAAQINLAISDEGLRAKLAAQALKDVKLHSWFLRASRILDLISK